MVDLDAVVANWRALADLSGPGTQTAAVVKADGYGLGIASVATALHRAGASMFFVAVAEEGAALRQVLGPGPAIAVFGGHMPGDADLIREQALTPMINSLDQLTLQFETLPGHPFGIQIDTGMARLGMAAAEWLAVAAIALERKPALVMSHLACADTPGHPMNAYQLAEFHDLTDGIGVPRSLAATGGILLGSDYHFDVTRPGIGIYGGAPFVQAQPVVRLALPVIQSREVAAGDPVGYGADWVADRASVIATVSGGYADGLLRRMGGAAVLHAGDIACPVVGRVSMDLMTVDVTALAQVPSSLDIIGPHQGVDMLAAAADTIGYEILTALGPRYARVHTGGGA